MISSNFVDREPVESQTISKEPEKSQISIWLLHIFLGSQGA
jgi:hypothetical protein